MLRFPCELIIVLCMHMINILKGREIAIMADLMYSGALQHLSNIHFDPVSEKAELKQRVG